MKKILLLIMMSVSVFAQKPLISEKQIGISLGRYSLDNIIVTEKINDYNSLSIGGGAYMYYKNRYSFGARFDFIILNNDSAEDTIIDTDLMIKNDFQKDLNAYIGAGYSISNIYNIKSPGYNILLGAEKKFANDISLSFECKYNDMEYYDLLGFNFSIKLYF